MKFITSAVLIAALTLGLYVQAAEQTHPTNRFVDVNPSNGALEDALKQAARNANAQGLTLYVELTTEWCIHCKRLMAAMKHPSMIDAYKGTYVAHIDGDIWSEKLRKMGFKFRGVPTIFAMDTNGKWVGKAIDCGEWNEDVTAEMAQTLKGFFSENAWANSTIPRATRS